MIQLLQAKNFRMLRSNSVALQPFQVLVGQNASGKSTFLSALQFLGDVLKGGAPFAVDLEQRLSPRARRPQDFRKALDENPKEIFEGLVRLLRLSRAPPLYTKIAERLSLPALKKEPAAQRIALRISSWFPPVRA